MIRTINSWDHSAALPIGSQLAAGGCYFAASSVASVAGYALGDDAANEFVLDWFGAGVPFATGMES